MRPVLVVCPSTTRSVEIEQALRPLDCRPFVVADVAEAFDVAAEREFVFGIVDRDAGRDANASALATRMPLVLFGAESAEAPYTLAVPDNVSRAELGRSLKVLLTGRRAEAQSGSDEVDPVIGTSTALARVLTTVEQTAPTGVTILLQGESGTGKEVLARRIHRLSGRKGPFVAVNCAALPEGLVESTLFGHEKGAFTGATQRVIGAFERAHTGTILLDEISEMSLALQAKLLRAIQEMTFERVGGEEPVKVDVRIVATTNRDLARAVDEGSFREDLYYRISVIPVLVPPLRDRREDIPALAEHFVRLAADSMNRDIRGIAPRALELLLGHDWPGNIRELAHVVERAVALCDGPILDTDDFIPEKRGIAPWRRPARNTGAPEAVAYLTSYSLVEAERVLIERALEATGGNRTRAAELLDISPRTLRNKLNRPSQKD